MKRWQTFLIGLIVSVGALFLALRQADFNAILEAFRTARYGFVVLSFLLVILTDAVRGWRWMVLTQGRLSLADGFWLFNVGFFFNNVLPARLGEFARAVLAGRRPGMHFTSALSSVIVERLFDMVSVVVLIGIVLIGLDLPAWATSAGAVMGAGAVLGLAFLAFAARRPEWALDIGARVLALAPRLTRESARAFLQPFVEGLGGVSDPRTFFAGFALSIFGWLFSSFAAWVLMMAFWPAPPPIMGVLSVAAAGLGIAVPAAPSGVGPFEAAVIGVFTAVGYNADVSRSFAFAMHAVNFVVTSALGIIGLLREGVSFSEVAREAEALREHLPTGDGPVAEIPPS